MSKSYRGRLAPSPTGAQHVGNARTYLIAWLQARSSDGEIVLRMEDIDSPRIKSGADQQALDDLRWLGLDWDGEVMVQSPRLHLYQSAFEQLQANEKVYPCTCTRRDVEQAASAPHEQGGVLVYPGTCAHRQAGDAKSLTETFSWRFRVPETSFTWEDVCLGSVTLSRAQLGGDFVAWKSTDEPAYQLAVVVDDAEQQITEVIRGDDLVPSTPRQLLLYQELELTPPTFAHVPLVVGTDGKRLAKRHGDTRLSALRAAGVSPESLIGLLAWSCGWLEKPVPVPARDLISLFDLRAIPAKPFVLEPALLQGIGYSP